MTVPSETNRSGPYNGNGFTTVFDYEFKITNENYIKVIKASAGVETVLTIDADYIVSDVGNPAGGQVALTVPLPTGQTLTLIPKVPFTQEIDLENQGAYYAQTVEDALDLAVMRDQQLQEQVSRAVLIPPSEDPAQLDGLIGDILRLADSADEVDTVANHVDAVQSAADNMAAIIAAPAQAAAAAASATAAAGSATAAAASATNAANSATGAAGSAASAATNAGILASLVAGFAAMWTTVLQTTTYAEAWLALNLNGSLSTRALIKALVPQAGMSVLLTEARRSGQFVWTLGDFSAQIAADTLEGMFLKANSVAATVGAWVRQTDYLNPGMFGGVSDWTGVAGTSTNNATALQKMIDIAKLTGLPMVISSGPGFYCNATLSASNMDFVLSANFGVGRVVFGAGATDGLVISQDNFEHATHIVSPTFTTIGQETGAGLKVTYSTADSTNNRNMPRCRLVDLDVRGEVLTSHGWRDGMVLTDVHRPNVVRPSITGRRDTGFTNRNSFNKMRYGINIVGSVGAIPSDIYIDNPRIDNAQEAISASGEVEGMLVNIPVLVGVLTGVRANYSSIRPWTQVRGGHINCFDYGVRLKNSPQSNINDLLVYKYQTSDLATVGVMLDGGCDESIIEKLRLINQASNAPANGEWDGVQVVDSSYVTINGILHDRPSRTVSISGTSTSCETRNLRPVGAYTGATVAAYIDTSSGANLRIGGNRKVASAKSAAVTVLSTATLVATSGVLNVSKGERYLIHAMINTTKGATAGEFLTSLNLTGSGFGVFDHDRSSILQRTAQAASTTVSHVISAVLSVTNSGTLAVNLNGTSTGSNSDVLAGDAQISVEML
ncbi:hypothetical protein EN784_04615 [bacterium M00.F.Ca.ET.141.01.1.1]|nr:hypothetical protein EN784_04615 [bacterium M00.F.Ca.ET.141.01.1.1]